MNILITGGTGYVGKNLISALIEQTNHNLFVITRSISDFPNGVIIIKDDSSLEDNIVSAKPDVVIHLASYLTSRAETEDIEKLIASNITFGTKLLNSLKSVQLKCFINVGSFSEFHFNDGVLNPTYLYSATKSAFRPILKYYSEINKFKIVNVTPFSIYGGIDSQKKIMDILFDAIDAKEPVKMSNGFQYLDFIHINDVVNFFVHLSNNFMLTDNEELYLGTGKPYNLREVASKIEQITGKKINADWGAYPPRARDTIHACAPIGKLKEKLSWQPKISIEEGLQLKYKEKK
ncbi:NAD-dependent epimerase/dehydratase family protein [Flavobacterium panacagri]|uniref:NAD-dependent epimerase/dehydratase family protein n=1 Tax=Flavobacterium panacagri TaxID=3034146 RepID=UPI0025A58C16|nr:NAD(P)-dependent oxidoreductase [Flavobacterium panacagri]